MNEKYKTGCERDFAWWETMEKINHSPIIDLSPDYQRCHAFSMEMSHNERYVTRGQEGLAPEVIYSQQLVSKLGEMTHYRVASSLYPDVKMPDFNIYAVKDKKWEPDNVMNGHKVAVKSQWLDDVEKGWTFQWWGGRGNSDRDYEIFSVKGASNTIAVFVVVDRDNMSGRIFSFNWVMDLGIDMQFVNPRKANLCGIKVVVPPLKLLQQGAIHDIGEINMYETKRQRWGKCKTDDIFLDMIKKSIESKIHY